MLYVDFKTYLPECLMSKIDIATMAASLEGRSPLLDHEFVELVFPMPGDWKLKGLRGHKWIMKEAFKDKLPPLIRNRSKMGFGIPLGAWFRGPLRTYWEDLVLSPGAGARIFQQASVRRLWDDHQTAAARTDTGCGSDARALAHECLEMSGDRSSGRKSAGAASKRRNGAALLPLHAS